MDSDPDGTDPSAADRQFERRTIGAFAALLTAMWLICGSVCVAFLVTGSWSLRAVVVIVFPPIMIVLLLRERARLR